MSIKRWDSIFLIVIILIAFFLRVYKLGEIPGSLNPDEVALGYTSYSLLKTGMDEHGKFLPLTLQSFGDWKLPIYSYIGIIPVASFGLTEFAVRFPSMLAGVIGVALLYFVSFSLFKKREIALFSALFFALSPWSIYFSRGAYEVNVATTIFLAGLLILIKYLDGMKKNKTLLLVGFVLISLTMFTQHNFIIFVPFFTFSLIIIFRRKIKWNKVFFTGFGLFCVFIFASYISTALGGSNKISTLVIINDRDILYNRVEKLRGDNAKKNQLFERVLHTKYLGVPYQIAQNYINSFSPSFLFDKGGEKLVHNLGGFGNLYLFDAFLLLLGFSGLFWNREKALNILLPWLFIGPISSMVTRDHPNSTRLFHMAPLFIMIASYGAYQILQILNKKNIKKYIAIGILTLIFLLNVLYFLDEYFVHMNHQRVRFWRYGYREAVKLTMEYPEYNVVMRGPENFPYIYFLFYTNYNPIQFSKEVLYYPQTSEGFNFVKSFGKYKFVESIDYTKLKQKTIYIDDISLENGENTITLPSGEPILKYMISED